MCFKKVLVTELTIAQLTECIFVEYPGFSVLSRGNDLSLRVGVGELVRAGAGGSRDDISRYRGKRRRIDGICGLNHNR